MKKQLLYSILLLMAATMSAETLDDRTREECERDRARIHAPHYYCDCHQKSHVFAFPLDTVIRDTTWYTATMNDLTQGISAYWFSDCSVTMEIYAFCTGWEPIYTMTIGKNQMRDVDAQFIYDKIKSMGSQYTGTISSLTPHMRVYPNCKNGSGRVYCYPYNEGPESTCDDPMEWRPGMTYVCEAQENVYCMKDYSLIPRSGNALIHWKQKKNLAAEMWLTLDSCTGEEIDRFALSDSLHVHRLDSDMLRDIRNAKRTLWLHVKHAKDIVGRVRMITDPEYTDPAEPVSKSTCMGKTIKVNERTYGKDTTFTDTVWVPVDTMLTMRLQTMDVNLSFTVPAMEYDTVYVLATEIGKGYRYKTTGTTIYEFGDRVLEKKQSNTCTRMIQLSVLEKEPEEGVEEVIDASRKAYKCLQNGQLFIIIDDHKYTLLGQPININKQY